MRESGPRPKKEYAPPKLERITGPAEKFIKELVRENKELGEKAVEDPLTGILNRRGAEEAIKRVVGMIPSPDHPYTREARLEHLTVALLDIDNLKQLNDRYGHPAGDKVIREVAAHLSEKLRVRTTDVVWRHGGEEFGIAFVGAGEQEVLDKLAGKVNVEVELGGEPLTVALSGGVTAFRPGEKIEDTLARADQALYAAKGAGRDRILPYAEPENETGK